MTIALKNPPPSDLHGQIESEIAEIVSILTEGLSGACRPVSVLWYGGLARGESGLYRYGQRWLPFGDYDLEVICADLPDREMVQRLEKTIQDRFGYRPVQAPVEETLVEQANTFNVLDLKFTTPELFVSRSPDLSTYDLLHSARVMYGEDLRSSLSLEIERVPLYSAYRIMQNRLFNALSLFHVDLWNPDRLLTHQQKVAFSLAICRIWLDFSMALSLCLGVYAPDFETRLKNLEQQGDKTATWFRDWKALLEGIRVAIHFKQNPQPERLNATALRHGFFLALESWDRVMRFLQAKLLPYYFGQGYEWEKVDYWSEAAEICQKQLPRRYYREYLQNLLSSRPNLPGERRLNWLASLANVHENYRYKGLGFLARHPRRSWISPEIVFFSVVPLLAYSVTPLGKIHYGMLNQALKLVAPYVRQRVTLTGRENWQQVKDLCVDLFSDYRRKRSKTRTLPGWLRKN